MQSKIVDEIEITPEEVRSFFKDIPNNELPTFGTELEISQIVMEPKVSQSEKERIINQLKSFKVDVEERGMSFPPKQSFTLKTLDQDPMEENIHCIEKNPEWLKNLGILLLACKRDKSRIPLKQILDGTYF